ncbi:MAG: M20/M25/M40 family metallo-hydrolase [Fibrobacterota bacterium]
MVNRERIIQTFMELAKIHGESRDENAVAAHLDRIFREEFGLTPEYDRAHESYGGSTPNMFVRVPGSLGGPPLMISAHMDTVVTGGMVQPVRQGEFIRSAGDTILGADDRAGLAQILELLAVLRENNIPHRPLLLAITAAEEIGLLGARYCQLSSSDAAMGVVLDITGPMGKIVHSAPYHDAWKISVSGISAHAGIAPEKGVNAIKIAAELIDRIGTGRISEHTTANIARIRGGEADNIVPDRVTILGEVRSRTEEELLAWEEGIRRICSDTQRKWSMDCSFSVHREYDGYTLADDASPIRELSAAVTAAGLTPHITATGGGSDANYFNRKGIPTAVISCGMAQVHTYNEEIRIDDLCDTVEILRHFVTTREA